MLASVIQIAGGALLTAAAFLAFGLAAGLAAGGVGLLVFGIAAELPGRRPGAEG